MLTFICRDSVVELIGASENSPYMVHQSNAGVDVSSLSVHEEDTHLEIEGCSKTTLFESCLPQGITIYYINTMLITSRAVRV